MQIQTFILQHLEDQHVCEYVIDIVPNKKDSIRSVSMKATALAKLRVTEAQLVRVGGYPRLLLLEDDLSVKLVNGPDVLLKRH